MNLIYFLGRFHVLVLHLPIGILLLAVLLEVLARRERFRSLGPAVNWVWGLGAASAVATAALGYMHMTEGGFDGSAVAEHRAAGTSLMLLAVVIAIVRIVKWPAYARIWPWSCAAIVILVTLTGHLGGNLTHGPTYLFEYGPTPLRRLAGIPVEAPRKKVTDVAQADLYLDVVAPALKQRCSTCHNTSKSSGKFSVESYASLMKGGEDGAVISPGNPAKSELFRRVNLPHENKEFMPKEGKTPLSPDQVAAIGWWISQGAPKVKRLASAQIPDAVRPTVMRVLGLAPARAQESDNPTQAADEVLPQTPPADPQAVAHLQSRGFLVRPATQTSQMVDIDITPLKPLQDADLADLAKIGVQIHSLNLAHASVTDAQLKTIGQFPNMVHLRLDESPVTDAGLRNLVNLTSLVSIDLYGSKVTQAGLEQLAALPKLKRIYAWQTAVADDGKQVQAGGGKVLLSTKPVNAGPMAATSPAQMTALEKVATPP